jgi:hypothetical protein
LLLRVIIRLGPSNNILTGFDIDTANFTGNEGPAADVWGLKLEGDEKEVERQEKSLKGDDPRVSLQVLENVTKERLTRNETNSGNSSCLLYLSDLAQGISSRSSLPKRRTLTSSYR